MDTSLEGAGKGLREGEKTGKGPMEQRGGKEGRSCPISVCDLPSATSFQSARLHANTFVPARSPPPPPAHLLSHFHSSNRATQTNERRAVAARCCDRGCDRIEVDLRRARRGRPKRRTADFGPVLLAFYVILRAPSLPLSSHAFWLWYVVRACAVNSRARAVQCRPKKRTLDGWIGCNFKLLSLFPLFCSSCFPSSIHPDSRPPSSDLCRAAPPPR